MAGSTAGIGSVNGMRLLPIKAGLQRVVLCSMKKIRIDLTVEELQALVTLTENQFFRMKFLDPKIPGYKAKPEEMRAAQSAVATIHKALNKEKGYNTGAAKSFTSFSFR